MTLEALAPPAVELGEAPLQLVLEQRDRLIFAGDLLVLGRERLLLLGLLALQTCAALLDGDGLLLQRRVSLEQLVECHRCTGTIPVERRNK